MVRRKRLWLRISECLICSHSDDVSKIYGVVHLWNDLEIVDLLASDYTGFIRLYDDCVFRESVIEEKRIIRLYTRHVSVVYAHVRDHEQQLLGVE